MDQLASLTVSVGMDRHDHVEQTLQRVLVDRAPELRQLYWRTTRLKSAGSGAYGAELLDDGSIALLANTTLCFDSYFGGFFESHWRLNTRLHSLVLSVTVTGACVVRLRRRSIGIDKLLSERVVGSDAGAQTLRFAVPDESGNFREYGLLYFEVSATGGDVRFLKAAWLAEPPPSPVRLGIVFCTFNRERFIAAVLKTMAADPVLLARLDRVFVVNQGKPGLARHPLVTPLADRLGSRLTIIEQGNFGGAGGFTRGLLATLDDPTLTHCAFLDDDIRLEPDTILRLIAFLSLAKDNVAVAGHMLDSVQPTRLYEGGAVIDSGNWFPRPVQQDTDLTQAGGLDLLTQPQPVHFNGWWCFAVPLDVVRRLGLPMPCFIRGDDAEYGMRLYRNGVRTIPLPGAAVWHEPFYLKLGSWQLYYETRNLLMLAAVHGRFGTKAALRRVGRAWLLHMLTFRYYGAALIMQGLCDFLAGPAVLRENPQPLHARIMALRRTYGPKQVNRHEVLDHASVASMPRRRGMFMVWFAFVLLRNALVPTRKTRPVIIGAGQFSWPGLRYADHIVLDNWWEPDMSVYRRDRGLFWTLSRQTMPMMLQLLRHGATVAASWRDAAPELTSTAFWTRYLLGDEAAKALPACDGRIRSGVVERPAARSPGIDA